MLTPTEPAVTEPILNPAIVTTNKTAGIEADAVVMTTLFVVVEPHVPVSCAMLLLPADIDDGVMDGAKNPEGKFSVIVPPIGTVVVGLKLTVTDTGARCAMRSFGAIANDTAETCPSIWPESNRF